jgi:hypothetical protein
MNNYGLIQAAMMSHNRWSTVLTSHPRDRSCNMLIAFHLVSMVLVWSSGKIHLGYPIYLTLTLFLTVIHDYQGHVYLIGYPNLNYP